MLTVKTPDEVLAIIDDLSAPLAVQPEIIPTDAACGRVLHGDIIAAEYVPGFDRSTVDGYAVIASDTFGCSDSIPAILTLSGEVEMGKAAPCAVTSGTCLAVSTGGDLPEGADAVVMLEYTDDYGDGLIGIARPVSPGENLIFKGDDVSPGDKILTAGTTLSPHDIGILSALGITDAQVHPRPLVGVISTGDELVAPSIAPNKGQIRDVNTPLLMAAVRQYGAETKSFGIVRDDEAALRDALLRAVSTCDIVLISGGSSAGMRDLTAKVIEAEGTLTFHGIAMKPGKPTILGTINGKAVWGLPGHPVAAYFVTMLFVRPLIARLMGAMVKQHTTTARLSEAISSNHGRAEYIAVTLDSGIAYPIRGKSGLIASLAHTDGYICVPRDCEGLAKGSEVLVNYF